LAGSGRVFDYSIPDFHVGMMQPSILGDNMLGSCGKRLCLPNSDTTRMQSRLLANFVRAATARRQQASAPDAAAAAVPADAGTPDAAPGTVIGCERSQTQRYETAGTTASPGWLGDEELSLRVYVVPIGNQLDAGDCRSPSAIAVHLLGIPVDLPPDVRPPP
jgi:hypothetical protein